jgi:toxin secretion/phage lysis holin
LEVEKMTKNILISIIGVIGSAIASAFGGWSTGLTTLVIFMAIDYLTGLIVAGVFHKSTKTETGTLESRAGFKGLCRKGAMLLVVLMAYRLDLAVGTAYIKDAVIIAFMANEAISIIENAGLMGVPMNDTLKNAIDVLQKKGSGRNEKHK